MKEPGRVLEKLGADEVLRRLRAGELFVFVDARRESEWRRATDKLPGALRLAPHGVDETLPIVRRGYAAVVYCTCPGEASSIAAAEHLSAHGAEHVIVLDGGLAAWRRARGPLEPVRGLARASAAQVEVQRDALQRRWARAAPRAQHAEHQAEGERRQ
jgi:rhodanese-related sulfurtransferase